jgi:hypothetical protein
MCEILHTFHVFKFKNCLKTYKQDQEGVIQWTHPSTQDHRQEAQQDTKQDGAQGLKNKWDAIIKHEIIKTYKLKINEN